MSGAEAAMQNVINLSTQVFCGGNVSFELRANVQILMVEALQHLSFDKLIEIYKIADTHPIELRILKTQLKTLQDSNGDVFGGGNLPGKLGDLFVQEAVIHGVENFAVENVFELLEVHHKTGARIDFAFDGDLESVV